MARIFGKGQATCLKRESESRTTEKEKKQQTNVIVAARLAAVSCLAVGCPPVCDNFDHLKDNGG